MQRYVPPSRRGEGGSGEGVAERRGLEGAGPHEPSQVGHGCNRRSPSSHRRALLPRARPAAAPVSLLSAAAIAALQLASQPAPYQVRLILLQDGAEIDAAACPLDCERQEGSGNAYTIFDPGMTRNGCCPHAFCSLASKLFAVASPTANMQEQR